MVSVHVGVRSDRVGEEPDKERKVMMKRVIACLLLVGGAAVFVSGCMTAEEASEHPQTEHPAKAAPKDHPAH